MFNAITMSGEHRTEYRFFVISEILESLLDSLFSCGSDLLRMVGKPLVLKKCGQRMRFTCHGSLLGIVTFRLVKIQWYHYPSPFAYRLAPLYYRLAPPRLGFFRRKSIMPITEQQLPQTIPISRQWSTFFLWKESAGKPLKRLAEKLQTDLGGIVSLGITQ